MQICAIWHVMARIYIYIYMLHSYLYLKTQEFGAIDNGNDDIRRRPVQRIQ